MMRCSRRLPAVIGASRDRDDQRSIADPEQRPGANVDHEDDDCLVKIDGEYYLSDIHEVVQLEDFSWELEDSAILCEANGKYYHNHDPDIMSHNGERMHKLDVPLDEVTNYMRYKLTGVLK